jgi:methyltransferase-like protein
MKENLMMAIPQLMKMTNKAGAMLEYNIATSHPNVVDSKNRYNTVTPMNVPSMA